MRLISWPALRNVSVSSAIASRFASDEADGAFFFITLASLFGFSTALGFSLFLLGYLALLFFKRVIGLPHF
jgi:hypothetical protein